MAKPNYQYEKRQRDMAKKKKQEEKRQQKLAGKTAGDDSGAGENPESTAPADDSAATADTDSGTPPEA
ncbi:MAG: hypothetical protein QG662_1998 [Pseudomonadota bacterium]|nr:hypothetical protein [Pseudomonadota bacterium]